MAPLQPMELTDKPGNLVMVTVRAGQVLQPEKTLQTKPVTTDIMAILLTRTGNYATIVMRGPCMLRNYWETMFWQHGDTFAILWYDNIVRAIIVPLGITIEKIVSATTKHNATVLMVGRPLSACRIGISPEDSRFPGAIPVLRQGRPIRVYFQPTVQLYDKGAALDMPAHCDETSSSAEGSSRH